MIAKAVTPGKLYRVEEWAAGLYRLGSLSRKEYLDLLRLIRNTLGVMASDRDDKHARDAKRENAGYRTKKRAAKKKAAKKKATKKRVGKVQKRAGTVFETWLKEQGYTKGRSGWLSPDKKKFFPL